MHYAVLPYGYKIIVNGSSDPFTTGLITEILETQDGDFCNKLSSVGEALYYCEACYISTDAAPISMLITDCSDPVCKVILIPSPALVELYGIEKAAMMLEKQCQTKVHEDIELGDDEFKDIYNTLSDELDEEVDEDDYTEENEEVNESANSAQPSEYLSSKTIRMLYKLHKASDMFRLKNSVKMFYRFGNNYFADFKDGVIVDMKSFVPRQVDIKWAKKISPRQIK